MLLTGTLVSIRPLAPSDARALHALRFGDRAFLEPWEPSRSRAFWTVEGQRALLEADERAAQEDRAYAFGVFTGEDESLIGRVVLANVVRGSWQNATLGYFIAERFNGRGFATDAVRLSLRFAFETAHLHRVQAAVMPRNVPSRRVLEKAGFAEEGFARRYLQINGVWEDHAMFALTVEDWQT